MEAVPEDEVKNVTLVVNLGTLLEIVEVVEDMVVDKDDQDPDQDHETEDVQEGQIHDRDLKVIQGKGHQKEETDQDQKKDVQTLTINGHVQEKNVQLQEMKDLVRILRNKGRLQGLDLDHLITVENQKNVKTQQGLVVDQDPAHLNKRMMTKQKTINMIVATRKNETVQMKTTNCCAHHKYTLQALYIVLLAENDILF